MAEYEKKVRKVLSDNGCTFLRHGKGDHDLWHSPINNQNVVVDSKIKSRHVWMPFFTTGFGDGANESYS